MRAGVIRNPKSHGNKGRPAPDRPDLLVIEPRSPEHLVEALNGFHEAGVELLIVDGGDGTVREVLSAMPASRYGEHRPLMAVLPSGKTNILAFDLGLGKEWTLDEMLAEAVKPVPKTMMRAPLRLTRDGANDLPLSGFVFGAAAFVLSKRTAEELHRWKVFRNLAIGLTMLDATFELMIGRGDGVWRRGQDLSLRLDQEPPRDGPRMLLMATTLQRLPFALRPFGPAVPGLKILDVDAPPRRLARAVWRVLWGPPSDWLETYGYRRRMAREMKLRLDGDVVLDGELYPGGAITVTEGAPIRFLTP
jgi:diacylglycerol kinase (ATP)